MSASSENSMARNLRIAGILLLCGLLVTIASLIWKAPLSFLMFAGIGGLLVFAGVALYLFSLVSLGSETQ
jgi:hypothetical protein